MEILLNYEQKANLMWFFCRMGKHLVGKPDLFVLGYMNRVIETNLAFACFHNSYDLMDRFLGTFIDFFANFL